MAHPAPDLLPALPPPGPGGGFSLRLCTFSGRLDLSYADGRGELSLRCSVSGLEGLEQEASCLLTENAPEA